MLTLRKGDLCKPCFIKRDAVSIWRGAFRRLTQRGLYRFCLPLTAVFSGELERLG